MTWKLHVKSLNTLLKVEPQLQAADERTLSLYMPVRAEARWPSRDGQMAAAPSPSVPGPDRGAGKPAGNHFGEHAAAAGASGSDPGREAKAP